MELILGCAMGIFAYVLLRSLENRYRPKPVSTRRMSKPLAFYQAISEATLKAVDDHVATQSVVLLTRPNNRGVIDGYAYVNQTLVEIPNPSFLPDHYLGSFMEHLRSGPDGLSPIDLHRVTLAVTKRNVRIQLQPQSTDWTHIIQFNPELIRADLLASYINIYLGTLAHEDN